MEIQMLTTATGRNPIILDTTIRDGSYAVNFQYNREDLRSIVGDLDGAGIPYIEIGHGVTIGASAAQGTAAQTDEDRSPSGAFTEQSLHRETRTRTLKD